jgi:subtilisin family serine protease
MNRSSRVTLLGVLVALAMVVYPGCGMEGVDPVDPNISGGVLEGDPAVVDPGLQMEGSWVDEYGIINHPDAVPGQYIVQFADDAMPGDPENITMATTQFAVNALLADNQIQQQVHVKAIWNQALKGFHAVMSREQAAILASDPRIQSVDQDVFIRQVGTQTGAPTNLGNLDGTDDTTYNYGTDGTGVVAYIFDSPILKTHTQIAGRVGAGKTTTGNCPDVANVTGVSGTAGGWVQVGEYVGGAVTITLSGGTGDPDMYVKRDADPSTTVYDCRPYKGANTTEQCIYGTDSGMDPQGTFHVWIKGYTAYSGWTLNVKTLVCNSVTIVAGSYMDLNGGGTTSCTSGGSHGAHVTGIVGGTTYGVAKGATLFPIAVFDCAGVGTAGAFITGANWLLLNHVHPSLANGSFEYGFVYGPVDTAINNVIAHGIFFVVAAGNSGGNYCTTHSPSTSNAFIVASASNSKVFSSFSDRGPCIDIISFGESILSLSNSSTSATQTMSGTSMASPHVAGIAAQYLSISGNANKTPAEVGAAIVANARSGVVTSVPSGTVNLLAKSFNTCTPSCSGKQCGSDGCGGSCGTCTSPATCNASFQCVTCTPNCSGRVCGPDPVCGSSCGTCTSPATCNGSGQCVTGDTWPKSSQSVTLNQFKQIGTWTGTDPLITFSGGTGDADLCIKLGSAPASMADCPGSDGGLTCVSEVSGNNESCNWKGFGKTGTFYIAAFGYTAASGFTANAVVAP